MAVYQFEVRRGDVVEFSKLAEVSDLREGWDEVHALAEAFDTPGSRIIVREATGGIVVSMGIRAAAELRGRAAA